MLRIIKYGALCLLNILCGCSENESMKDAASLKWLSKIDYQLRTLNEAGQVTDTFKEGENPVLSFIIINHNDFNLSFNQGVPDDFMRVFRKERSGSLTDMGKPFKTIFCTYVLGVQVPANDTLKLEIPWASSPTDYPKDHFCMVDRNEPLRVGDYQTGFTKDFQYLTDGRSVGLGPKSLKWTFRVLRK